jgi:DNA-binding IclR family transcriptional regulator
MRKPSETPGAQNMRRSLQVLRVLGRHQEDGISATDVMDEAALERSTAHRLLTCLVEEGFAERDPITRRFRLGMDAMQLGLASLRRAPLLAYYQPVMQRLARTSGDTVYLLVRQGDFTICLHREDGPYPVKVFSTRVGDARLLGIGVGGMALLAASPDDDVGRIHANHAEAFEAAGLGAAQFGRIIARTRRTGLSELLDTITAGVGGVGMAIPNPGGMPFAALSIASIKARMGTSRRAELGALLGSELAQVLKPPGKKTKA